LAEGKLASFSFALQTPHFTCKMTKKKSKSSFISGPVRLPEIFWIVARYYRAIYDNIAIFSEGVKYRAIFADNIVVDRFADNIANIAILSRCW
jgi:hypothetical protein